MRLCRLARISRLAPPYKCNYTLRLTTKSCDWSEMPRVRLSAAGQVQKILPPSASYTPSTCLSFFFPMMMAVISVKVTVVSTPT